MENYFFEYFNEFSKLINKVDHNNLREVALLANEVKKKNKKIIMVGNGGSASIASHLAVDFTKAAGVRSITFNESSLLTCFGNDYGYQNWVKKALEFYADKQDLIILISSSGASKNIINGAKKAKEMNCKVVTFSGFSEDNGLNNLGDLNFWVNSNVYNYLETIHQIWLLSAVDYLIQLNNK